MAVAGAVNTIVGGALNSAQRVVLSELRRYIGTSDIWREFLRYAGVSNKNDLEKFMTERRYETAREAKEALAEPIIAEFEADVKASYEEYLRHMGMQDEDIEYRHTRGAQSGGWLGLDDDIQSKIDEYLNKFNSGGRIQYAKALVKWKNNPNLDEWVWSDWYISGDDIHEEGGYKEKLLIDLLGFKKLEGIKNIWSHMNNR